MLCFLGNDHAGVDIKNSIINMLEERGVSVINLGVDEQNSVDYPDYAKAVCESVLKNPASFGILFCGTGIGMSIAANKIKGIRAALCHDAYSAMMARAHNDANVLCFGARSLGIGTISSIIDAWLKTSFEGGRHQNRVNKITKMES